MLKKINGKVVFVIVYSFIFMNLFHVYAQKCNPVLFAEFKVDEFFALEDGRLCEERPYYLGPEGMYFVNNDTFHLYSEKLKEDRYFTRKSDGSYTVEKFSSENNSFSTNSKGYWRMYVSEDDFINGVKEEDKCLFEDIYCASNCYVSLTDDSKELLYLFYLYGKIVPGKFPFILDPVRSKGVLVIKDLKTSRAVYRTLAINEDIKNEQIHSEGDVFLFKAPLLSACDKDGNFYFFNLVDKDSEKVWQLMRIENTWWEELGL